MSGRIPIPTSFSTVVRPLTPSNANDDEDDAEDAAEPQTQQCLGDRLEPSPSEQDRLVLALNEEWMLQLERALQIYLFQQETSSVTYLNLCRLVPKLALPLTTTTNDNDADSNVRLQQLCKEERLWHDFACVAVPRLYTMVERSVSQGVIVLELQRVTHHKNRLHELRRLVQEAQLYGVPQKLSAKILDWLAQDKARRQERNAAATETVAATEPTLQQLEKENHQKTPLQALEERIRAKAQERLRAVEQAERRQQKEPNEDLVTVADAIFSQARHLLRQRNHSHLYHRTNGTFTSQTKTTTTLCKVSLMKLLAAMPGYTRLQLSTALLQLHETCPQFVSWTIVKEDDSSKSKAVSIPKNATVTIETSQYKAVRAALLQTTTTDKNVVASPASVAEPLGLQQHTPRHLPTTAVPAVTVSGHKRGSFADTTVNHASKKTRGNQ